MPETCAPDRSAMEELRAALADIPGGRYSDGAHDTDTDDCICGPTAKPVERDDGSIAWMQVHHSLDGRELSEPDRR